MKSYKEFKVEIMKIKERLTSEILEKEGEILRARTEAERMLFRGEKTGLVIARSMIEKVLEEVSE